MTAPVRTEGRTTTTSLVSAEFSGPLPPPNMLAAYEQVFPGCAERIVAMAEGQSAHRQHIEKTVIEGNVAAERRGQYLGSTIAMIAVLGGIALIYADKNAMGIATIISTLVALSGVFVYGRTQQARERREKLVSQPQPTQHQ